jgi:hypothetical protein
MTGNRAALALVTLAVLGPAVAFGANALITDSDAFSHGRLVGLWVLSVVWMLVCLIGASTQLRRHR